MNGIDMLLKSIGFNADDLKLQAEAFKMFCNKINTDLESIKKMQVEILLRLKTQDETSARLIPRIPDIGEISDGKRNGTENG
jgi:hypothetical protein